MKMRKIELTEEQIGYLNCVLGAELEDLLEHIKKQLQSIKQLVDYPMHISGKDVGNLAYELENSYKERENLFEILEKIESPSIRRISQKK